MREFEGWPSDVILVIGGGKSWLDWAKQFSHQREIFCLDRDFHPSLSYDPHFIKGDVLKLESSLSNSELKGRRIAGIYSDFLRSESLKNLSLSGAKTGKIILKKIGVSYPGARSEDWY